jgi:hypothetical protein
MGGGLFATSEVMNNLSFYCLGGALLLLPAVLIFTALYQTDQPGNSTGCSGATEDQYLGTQRTVP